MYGGLVAVPVSVLLLAILHIPFWAFWDVATFTMLTGMIFARVGCLLNGCCGGRPTDSRFGMVLANHDGVRARRVPTQVLEATLAVILLGLAAILAASPAPPGSVFTGSLGLYAVVRLFLQPLREHQSRVAGVPALRAASAVLLALALLSILPRLA
jgi:phosphatidylglycerol:prolipoprotein diacylglycerol transferase